MSASNLVLVLVVEDNAIIRQTVEDALSDGGYAVKTASTGEEAIGLLDAADAGFSALITDINLAPGKLEGWDVARHARELKPELPIVYMTGTNGDHWASQGVPKSLLLSKPFASAQLVTAVSQLLNSQVSSGD